jgi:hypothetical protein
MDRRFGITGPNVKVYLTEVFWPPASFSIFLFLFWILVVAAVYYSLGQIVRYRGFGYIVSSIFWILASTVPGYLFVLNAYNNRHLEGTGGFFTLPWPWDYGIWEFWIPILLMAGQLLTGMVFLYLWLDARSASKTDRLEDE